MKSEVFTVALALAVPLVPLRAVDARVVEGVKLDGLKQTQRLEELPEIYERDPDNPPRFRVRKAVIDVPLDTARLSFNAELNSFYLNKIPGGDAATYVGPVAGDIFEVFKLEEKYIAQLRKDYAPDVEYRVALMVRSGNAKLRERALRIMTAGLATDVSVRTRAAHLPRFRDLADGLKGDDLASLRAAIAETDQRYSESIPTLPDSAYSPGNGELARQGKLQDWMKPGVAVPDTAWGKASNGLRASAAFSTTEPKQGQEISVWLLVENDGDKEIRFTFSDMMQMAQPKITRADGTKVQTKGSRYSGISPLLHHKLKPGERLTLAMKTLFFDEKESAGVMGFGSNHAVAGRGEYSVRYDTGQMNGYAKGDWDGQLTTAETKIVIKGQSGADAGESK
jgi:hypothetical protein